MNSRTAGLSDSSSASPSLDGRHWQWCDGQFLLTAEAQGYAARGQDVHSRAAGEHLRHDRRDGGHEMLAVIEDEEEVRRRSARTRRSIKGRSPPSGTPSVRAMAGSTRSASLSGSQVNEHPTVIELSDHIVGNCKGQARLADATRTGERQEWNGLVE